MNTFTVDVPKPVTERNKVIITVKRKFGDRDLCKLYAEYAALKIKQGMTEMIDAPKGNPCISK